MTLKIEMVEWWFQVSFSLGRGLKRNQYRVHWHRQSCWSFDFYSTAMKLPKKTRNKGEWAKRKRGREGKEEGTKPHLLYLDFTTPVKFFKTFMTPLGTWSWHMTQRGDAVIKIVISNYKCRACGMMLFLCKRIPETGASQKLYWHITVHTDSYCQAASISAH